jgi:hypothetical protein
MSGLKTTKNNASVKAFIDGIEDENKRRDAKKIAKIMREVTGKRASMWGDSIIGYGTYHYKNRSGREADWMATGFSPRKQNMTLYIMTGFDGHQKLMDKLGKYKTGKSCLYIKKLEDVDEDVLRRLIKNSYDYITEKYPPK